MLHFTKILRKGGRVPFWAEMYVVSLILSAAFTIYFTRSHSLLYMASQLASALLTSAFFFIYYSQIPYPKSIVTPVLMLLFILFQEVWVNRHLYDLISLRHFPKKYHRQLLFWLPFLTVLYIAPVIWVIVQVFKHYFLFI